MVAAYRFKPVITLLLLALLLVAVLLSLALGPVAIPLGDTLRVLLRWFSTADLPTDQVLIIEHIRLPRTLMGILVGATLALTGAAMQGLFRNPLADPGLIGVSSGAALGAALMIVLGSSMLSALPSFVLPYATVLGAFAGGVITTWLVYRLGQLSCRRCHVAYVDVLEHGQSGQRKLSASSGVSAMLCPGLVAFAATGQGAERAAAG